MKVAVVGATGMVGNVILKVLEERNFPVSELIPVASERSVGKTIEFRGKPYKIVGLTDAVNMKPDVALFSAGGNTSLEWATKFAKIGTTVIDNSSAFRMDQDKKLVVPEINAKALTKEDKIIANPNCSTIQMMLALKPIYDAYGIDRINVSTYQAVSGAGKEAVDELAKQTANLMNARPMDNEIFPKQIAFNVIPQIDSFEDNGYTREEMKMVNETHKILGDTTIAINPTCVRVPVFFGHSESINIETRMQYDFEHVKQLLNDAPGVELIDDEGDYPTAVSDASGNDTVYVGRLRADISHPHGLNMWVVSDNTRKGAATNSVQIAEELIENYM